MVVLENIPASHTFDGSCHRKRIENVISTFRTDSTRKERVIQRVPYPRFSKQGNGVNRNSLAICTNAASKDWGNSQEKIHSLITASRKPITLVGIVPERGVERVSPDAAGHVAAAFRAAAGHHRFGHGGTGDQLPKHAEPGV